MNISIKSMMTFIFQRFFKISHHFFIFLWSNSIQTFII